MKTKTSIPALATMACVAALMLGASGAAQAHDDNIFWSIGMSAPGMQVGVSNAPVVVVQPPVYMAPRPIYVTPRPVVYVPPVPVYYGYPGWGYRHHEEHEGYRGEGYRGEQRYAYGRGHAEYGRESRWEGRGEGRHRD